MRHLLNSLAAILCTVLFAPSAFGWNNQHWLGNCDRVVNWTQNTPADYLRIGVLKEGLYRISAHDIAVASGVPTNTVTELLNTGGLSLTQTTNDVAWYSDGINLYFYGQPTSHLYAPENVYFLRFIPGVTISNTSAPLPASGGTNAWFMQKLSYRSQFLDVTHYFDRRSSNASITNAPVFGFSLGDSYCNNTRCEFNAQLPGFLSAAATNLNLTVHAISYGDYGVTAANDTHTFNLTLDDIPCGTYSWSRERLVSPGFHLASTLVSNDNPIVKIINPAPAEHILLLDLDIEYPRTYHVAGEPLLCSGGVEPNICINGDDNSSAVMLWKITDPLQPLNFEAQTNSVGNGWSVIFSGGDATDRYAVFTSDTCFEPSVTGFRDINWLAPKAMPSLAIITPPRRWVSGFETALAPLVRLRRAQGLSVRVIDAEDIYNSFSHGLVTPHAFQNFAAAGADHPYRKLRYLLFAGYASTDYKLEVFKPDTVFKNGLKGFPALFPLLQFSQIEPSSQAMLLLPNDLILGDGDGDGVPDVAVGRLPATDAADLTNMVAKTVAHDLKNFWNRATSVADWNYYHGDDFDFSGVASAFSDDLSTSGWNSNYYYCDGDTGYPLIWDYMFAANDIKRDLENGIDLFFFLGHSQDTLMGHSSGEDKFLFKISATYQNQRNLDLADWPYPPAAIALGCRMGRYTSLDVVNLTTCIMESAARNPDSAFSLSFSASGYLKFDDARALTELLAAEITLYRAGRFGDALLAAYDQIGAADLADIQHLVLLGDPAMPLYKPRYPTLIKIE